MCHPAQIRLHVIRSYSYDIPYTFKEDTNRSETAGEENEMCIFSQVKEYISERRWQHECLQR